MRARIVFLTALPALLHAQGLGTRDGTYSPTWMGLPGSIYDRSGPWGDARDASWPLTQDTINLPLKPQKANAELQGMLKEVGENRIKTIVSTLVDFGTRHTLSEQNSSTRGIGAARDWIYRQMQNAAEPSNGKMDVYFNSYIQDVDGSRIPFPVNITNVVAQINRTKDPTRAYVVTGHYDSRRMDIMDYEGDAPGADDDATGAAVVMELARICAKKQPAATMTFAAVAGEEHSLYGSA